MRIGVVSDTHGSVAHTQPAIRMLESLDVEAVLHCGDIGSAEVVELFAPWPTHFVFGNCDYDHADLRRAIESSGKTCHGEFGELRLADTPVALLHSHDRRRFRETISSGSYPLVCYGHTHVAATDRQGDTLVLNPGALYRANPPSIAVVESADGRGDDRPALARQAVRRSVRGGELRLGGAVVVLHQVRVFGRVVVEVTQDRRGAEPDAAEEQLSRQRLVSRTSSDSRVRRWLLSLPISLSTICEPTPRRRASFATAKFSKMQPRLVQLVDHEAEHPLAPLGDHADAVATAEARDEVLLRPGELERLLLDAEHLLHVAADHPADVDFEPRRALGDRHRGLLARSLPTPAPVAGAAGLVSLD